MNKDLYLVRHGQTIFNLKRIIQGWSDSPLTQLGCDQAARAGMFCVRAALGPTTSTPPHFIAPSRLSPTCGRAWRTSAWTACVSGSLATLRPSA